LCAERPPERIFGYVEGKHTLPVDLDDRQQLPIAPFELGIAADVDFLKLEVELVPHGRDRRARSVAEVASLRAVEDDPGYG